MDKNWLIRTKSNHILGPVSKEKVVELYQNGSIKPDDEVCTGNGYWFFIREEDLVKRYIIGSEAQGFNPISEAKDVLVKKNNVPEESENSSDLTLVGGIDLSLLGTKTVDPLMQVPKDEEKEQVEDLPIADETPPDINLTSQSQETKKKSKIKPRKVAPPREKQDNLKKQNWLRYISIIGFIILFLIIYFRKRIIERFFDSDSISINISLINKAYAQDLSLKKKKILEETIHFEKLSFSPHIGLDGFKVISNLEIAELECSTFQEDIYQLGVILYPPEKINEKFLIKLRDCVLKLAANHPLKKWLQWIAETKKINTKDQDTVAFIEELIFSHFNLITDQKVKEQIIKIININPENTIPEKILKSYLYLLIGNIARSDRLLLDIVNTPPRVNWENKTAKSKSLFHQIGSTKIEQLMNKISKHPTDRKPLHLLLLYFKSYYNDSNLLKFIDELDTSDTTAKLHLNYIESLAPELINFIKVSNLSDKKRISEIRMQKRDFKEQAYWLWGFIDIGPLISDELYPTLAELEKNDEMWFIYLIQDEKLSDLISKKNGKSFLPSRRMFLKNGLSTRSTMMMSLYKLIQIGDIDKELIDKTITHLIHE